MATTTEAPASHVRAPTEFIRGIGPLAAISLVVGLDDRLGDLHRLRRHRAAGVGSGDRARCWSSGSSPGP